MIDVTMTPRPPAACALSRLKRRLAGASLCITSLAGVLAPLPALAQDEDEIKMDARLEGYEGTNVSVPNQSTALIWLLFVFLGVVGLAALFKDAKRTHLD